MAPLQSVQSLAQWFDAGYAQSDGNLSVKKPLPSGYSGANNGNLFVKSKTNGVVIWPVRLDLGEMPSGNTPVKSSTCTLYHYTHRQSLVSCAQIFSQVAEDSVKENALRELLRLVKEDCRSRCSLVDAANPHAGKVLMTSMEPTQFEDSAAIHQEIFGRNASSDKVWCESGEQVPAKEIGKCCIAIRVRAVMCAGVQPTDSQQGQVVLNVDRLDREIQKIITARRVQQKQQEKDEQESKKRCFPWPFGRKSNQNRSRSKSRDALEKKALVKQASQDQLDEKANSEKHLSGQELKDAQDALIAQKKRAIRVKQYNDSLLAETKQRAQMHNNLDNVITAVHSKENQRETVRSESKGPTQRKRAGSISVVDSTKNSSKSTKRDSKGGLTLSNIGLLIEDGDSNDSEYSLVRSERSEFSATIKTKGSWKNWSKRQEMSSTVATS
jgi:hypothetical protein